MQLVKMNQADYDHWEPRSRADYAKEKMKANRLTEAEAQQIAENDFKRILPNGLQTKDNFLYSIQDAQKNKVGYIWFAARGASDNKKAFIYDIVVESDYRGKGYGKAAMLLLEEEVKKVGLTEIGLHVFGYNSVAVGLYKSLGYETTDLVMAKTLS